MAQWGRTTDIEWIYRVEVDAKGRRVAGSGVFQSPNHGTTMFHGRYDGTHPLLQTCTSNNNVCDARALKRQRRTADPMRFALSTRDVLGADQPREHEMDLHPWTYQVMGREMVREHKVTDHRPRPVDRGARRPAHLPLPRPGPDARRRQRRPRRGRRPEERPDDDVHVGPLGIGTFFTIHRRGPAATTVKLPPGTTAADIESISVRRVTPLLPGGTDSGAS